MFYSQPPTLLVKTEHILGHVVTAIVRKIEMCNIVPEFRPLE